jgi:epoxyqueuosine reductase QueG
MARDAGIDVVGFGDVRDALPQDFQHLPVGVSLGRVHPGMRWLRDQHKVPAFGVAEELLSDHRDRAGQEQLETALRALADFLRAEGFRYFCCPPDVDPMESPFTALMTRRFSHKAAATCAGLGWVGRHGLLNHPVYGPHVSWATIVTNAPLATSIPVVEGQCEDCRQCLTVCPSGALSGRNWSRSDGMTSVVDAERCRQALDANERLTGRRICGRCATACALAKLSREQPGSRS